MTVEPVRGRAFDRSYPMKQCNSPDTNDASIQLSCTTCLFAIHPVLPALAPPTGFPHLPFPPSCICLSFLGWKIDRPTPSRQIRFPPSFFPPRPTPSRHHVPARFGTSMAPMRDGSGDGEASGGHGGSLVRLARSTKDGGKEGGRLHATVLRFADGKARRPRRFGRDGAWRCEDGDGEGFVAAATKPEACGWALATYNRKKGTMEVMDVPKGTLRMLAERGIERADAVETEEKGGADERNAKRKKLLHVFGSQKRRRQEMRRDASRVETGQVGDAHLQANLQAAVAQQVEQWGGERKDLNDEAGKKGITKEAWMERAAKEARKGLPTHVEDATDPRKAYPIDRVVPHDLRQAIQELAENLLQAARSQADKDDCDGGGGARRDDGLLDGQGWPIYLKKHADAWLAQAKNEEEETVLKHVLGYLTLLLIFHVAGGFTKSAAQLGEKLNVTAEVARHLMSRFMEEVGQEGGGAAYQKSRNSTLSLQYHILLLLLILHKYIMDPEELPGQLRLSMKEVLMRFREMGADYRITTTKGKKHYVVRLLQNNSEGATLQSKFPALKIGRGR
eukprot:scaffold316_cov352-Pavlova_lutheri.AAC.12